MKFALETRLTNCSKAPTKKELIETQKARQRLVAEKKIVIPRLEPQKGLVAGGTSRLANFFTNMQCVSHGVFVNLYTVIDDMSIS